MKHKVISLIGFILIASCVDQPVQRMSVHAEPSIAYAAQESADKGDDLAQISVLPTLSKLKLRWTPQVRYNISSSGELKRIDDKSLTPGDKRLLAEMMLPSGVEISGTSPYQSVMGFGSKHGKLPTKVSDLFPELGTKVGRSKLLKTDNTAILAKYSQVINPVSGKFYASLGSKSWTPGGFYIERIKVSDYVKSFGDPKLKCKQELQAWHYRVYGEKQNTVVVDQVVAKCREDGVPWKGDYAPAPSP